MILAYLVLVKATVSFEIQLKIILFISGPYVPQKLMLLTLNV